MKKGKHNLLHYLLLAGSCLFLLVGILSACTPKKTDDVTTDSEGTSPQETTADTAADTKENTETGTEAETNATPALPEERSIGSANVALGCPVITNGCKDGSNQNLTDRSGDTDYVSDEHKDFYPFEVVVDLTRSYPVNGIRLQDGSAKKVGKLTGFTLSVSADGRTYNQVADQSALKDGQLLLDKVTNARYVKITATEVTKGSSGKYAISLSEMEVLSEITTYDNLLPQKRALAMQPGATDQFAVRCRLGTPAGTLQWVSDRPDVVSVEKTTGEITAHADGTATIYVSDGKNCTAIPVTVATPKPAYTISTFYLANHAPNTLEVFDYLKECGITFIENCRPYDYYGNLTTEYLRVMANDYGLTLSVADPVKEDAWLSVTESEITAIVNRYKNLPGIGGIYLRDEPSQPNIFAPIYRTVVAADPASNPHLNLLPNIGGDYYGYVSDWVATVGSQNLKSLSYDMYPFGTSRNSINNAVYDHLDLYRRVGNTWGVNTGYYMQAMGINGAYRVPNDNEMMYYASLGVAYGLKEFKWFVWFTPPYSGEGEHFITGILDSEGKKSALFDGVTAVDKMLSTLSPYLANTDSVAVYHTDGKNGNKLPADFCLHTAGSYIVSVMRDRTDGQEYLVVVNKSFRKDAIADFTVIGNSLDLSAVADITSGTPAALKKTGNGFSLSLKAGGLAVLRLPQGYSILPAAGQKDGENLLEGCGASVSSSAGDGRYAYMLNDGDHSTNFATAEAQTGWILYDLHTVRSFNRVDIYPASGQAVGFFFPKALSVWISEDGKEFRKVASYTDIDAYKWDSIRFETVRARYIRIDLDEIGERVGQRFAEIGEIEVYLDNGNLPAMVLPEEKELKPAENGNLLLGQTPYVSSSYEEYGWTKNQLTDGRIGMNVGVHQGWCSMIGSKTRDITEWVMFALGKPITVSKMIVYPSYDNEFVEDYHVEVSMDGSTWTTVWSITGDNKDNGDPRVMTFDPVEARYVRFVVTKMGNGNPASAIGYKVQIGEIELYR